MGTVIDWKDVLARYAELDKLPGISLAPDRDNIIAQAEGYIHSRLSGSFTVPFSSDNITAKDLMVDALYVQMQLTRQPEKAKAVKEFLDERINALNAGVMSMVTSAGAVTAQSVGDTIWTSDDDHHPTFGVSDIELSIVSSQHLADEADARGEL